MIVAVIQARVGSSRLPGKMLVPIQGIPLVAHTIRRVKEANLVNRTVLAIPDTAENDELAKIGEAEGVDVYRGSEHDVLARFFWAIQRYQDVNAVVRICGEDVYQDPELIDRAIAGFLRLWAEPDERVGAPQYMEQGGAYWAVGMQVEVFSRDALELAYMKAYEPWDREHVTQWMKANFYQCILKDSKNRATAATKLSVDTLEDLSLALKIYEKCYRASPAFGYDQTLAALEELQVAA